MSRRRLTANRCLCRGCGEFFNSVRSFDRHRVWDSHTVRRCLAPAEMEQKGMTNNASGFWITEPRRKHRLKAATSQIPAALRNTPVGHQGGNL